jgi:Sodium/hydrogen exchanger family
MGDVAHRLTEAEVVAFVLVDLALIVALARIVGWAFAKLGQPRVIGEIVAGLLLGPTILGGSVATGQGDNGSGIIGELFPLQAFEFLNLMATVALVLFMLLVGLEVEQRFFHGRGAADRRARARRHRRAVLDRVRSGGGPDPERVRHWAARCPRVRSREAGPRGRAGGIPLRGRATGAPLGTSTAATARGGVLSADVFALLLIGTILAGAAADRSASRR